MKKVVVFLASALLLATPMIAAAADGIQGECSDCHTMHNSQQGEPVAITGTDGALSSAPIQNLLKMDCIACHANPDAIGPTLDLDGGSTVPQVFWNNTDPFNSDNLTGTKDLAAGNFYYSSQSDRKGHNVIDLGGADGSNAGTVGSAEYGAPPGNAHADHHGMDAGVFSVDAPFDAFTCAGARGCHGTRSQTLPGVTADYDTNAATPNTWEAQRRTGIAAISGAHHNSYDGAKTSTGYATGPQQHDGAVVADGYRFIPGLEGYGNTTARWMNENSTSHNEYYGDAGISEVSGCGDCHQEGDAGGTSSRGTSNSYMKVPGNSMSGFCATCHGVFHSTGGANGTSGAFLRHPSDWVIPTTGEYSGYTTYNITAPVARNSVPSSASASVDGASGDMVMCLSCHEAHATPNDYMLRFNYADMQAGNASAGLGQGCLACHTDKGILPEAR